VITVVSITTDCLDRQFQTLRDLAAVHGIMHEVLLRVSLRDWQRQKNEFVDAANHVLIKILSFMAV